MPAASASEVGATGRPVPVPSLGRALGLGLTAFVALTLLLFATYRAIFLARFAPSLDFATTGRVLAAGARLDVALLGFELAILGGISLCRGRLRLREAVLCGLLLTVLHALAAAASFFTYQERGQQLGEILVPYLTEPRLVYLAVRPFFVSHSGLALAILAALAAVACAVAWLLARVPRQEVLLRSSPLRALSVAGLCCAPLVLALEPFVVKRTNRASGWSVKFTHSKFYSLFSSFTVNQAVENPIHELFRVYLPAALRTTKPFQLTEDRAMEVLKDAIGRETADPRYPLRTTIRSDVALGLENVVIVEVEGLTRAIFEHVEAGRAVMPFLNRLAQEGLEFTGAIQSFNATSGSVFATATSLPSGGFDDPTQRFASYEMKGVYGSLPRVLGTEEYEHYFCLASRHSAQDFPGFFRNQGFKALGHAEIIDRIRARDASEPGLLEAAEDALGVVDGAFLEECARIIAECPRKVCMHLVTNTSHSPWQTPPAFDRRFDNDYFNTFAYVDASIEAFVTRLQRDFPRWDQTLFVVVADHTSVQIDEDFLDRLRIPLIFWSARIGTLKTRAAPLLAAPASHIDILPTVLWLLGGTHEFAGLGRSLLDPSARAPGVVSGNSYGAYYLKGQHVLEYAPDRAGVRLFEIRDGRIELVEAAAQKSGVLPELRDELLAQLETAKRLGMVRRVWPDSSSQGR